MSEADMLFKELGYEHDTNWENDGYITYKKEKDKEYTEAIDFKLNQREFRKTLIDNTNFFRIKAYITFEELKAINMKVKELGWEE